VVIRILTQKQSFILKQSRPFVHKYPQIPAPLERIFVEKAYYDIINQNEFLKSFSPKILSVEKIFHLLVMEDLGSGSDFLGLYKDKTKLNDNQLEKLILYLNTLHELPVNDFPDNFQMKKLNHEHIFLYPFMSENGFDLNSIQMGLQQIAMPYKTDEALKGKIKKLGERYLENGSHLLHGDFYPGSWLNTLSGIKVIDPEFAFLGDREFDLGVFVAHLKMSKYSKAKINQVLSVYQKQNNINLSLLQAYTGVEILRRLIGLAQLPLSLSLEDKGELLEEAAQLINQ
jgi:5-methylthioribose kinase